MYDNDFGKLGFYSLGLLYTTFALVSFVSMSIVKKLGARLSLTIGSFCYVFYVSSFMLPAYKTENP